MKKSLVALSILAFSMLAYAQAAPEAAQTFDLKDGGKIVVMKDGKMAHMDATGKRIAMKDGTKMEGKDGATLMMKNNAIWKQLSEHGTLKPGH